MEPSTTNNGVGDPWTIFHVGPDQYAILIACGNGVRINFKGVTEKKAEHKLNLAMTELPLNREDRDHIRVIMQRERRSWIPALRGEK